MIRTQDLWDRIPWAMGSDLCFGLSRMQNGVFEEEKSIQVLAGTPCVDFLSQVLSVKDACSKVCRDGRRGAHGS